MLKIFNRNPSLESFDDNLTRDQLKRRSRIVFIDDETPLLIEELKKEGFAVDHDSTGDDLSKIEHELYDLAILDYHGVGKRLGDEHGIGILKHIRRVSPSTRVLAYTSRSLSASESAFFTDSHDVLSKDEGLVDSMAIIEKELRKAFSKQHLFDAMIEKLQISDNKIKEKVRAQLTSHLSKHDQSGFSKFVLKIAGDVAEKGVTALIEKLFLGAT